MYRPDRKPKYPIPHIPTPHPNTQWQWLVIHILCEGDKQTCGLSCLLQVLIRVSQHNKQQKIHTNQRGNRFVFVLISVNMPNPVWKQCGYIDAFTIHSKAEPQCRLDCFHEQDELPWNKWPSLKIGRKRMEQNCFHFTDEKPINSLNIMLKEPSHINKYL